MTRSVTNVFNPDEKCSLVFLKLENITEKKERCQGDVYKHV